MLGTDDTLAQSRAYGTTEERKVIALETIADQLRLIAELLMPPNVLTAEGSQGGSVRTGRATTAWENEGGSTKG